MLKLALTSLVLTMTITTVTLTALTKKRQQRTSNEMWRRLLSALDTDTTMIKPKPSV